MYADDTIAICNNEHELHRSIKLLEEWSTGNEMLINKRKSGILVMYKSKPKKPI